MVKLRPNLELFSRTYLGRKGKREEGLTPDNLLLYLVDKLTTNPICFSGWKMKDFRKG